MKILSCSDVHLDTFQAFATPTSNVVSNTRLENTLKGLDSFFDYGAKQGIKYYVINGDLFNQRLHINPGMYSYCINRIISKYRETPNASFLFINVGNHDEQSRYIHPNSINLLQSFSTDKHKIIVAQDESNIYSLDSLTNIMLIPFTEDIKKSKEAINNNLSSLSKGTFIFAHLGVVGSLSGRWSHKLDGAYTLGDLGWNNQFIKAITLGHYHLRQTLKKSKNKEAWYQGDLLPINFNDVEKSGLGSKRGFDLIDTNTGKHQFIPLTDTLPTFNIIELDKTALSLESIMDLAKTNFIKLIVTSDKSKNEVVKAADKYKDNILITVQHKIEVRKELDINENSSDNEILTKYCNKYFKDVKNEALEYLNKVAE